MVCHAIMQRHKDMYKLKELFGHVQEGQAAGKALNEVRTQIIRHADGRSAWEASARTGKGWFDGRDRRACKRALPAVQG